MVRKYGEVADIIMKTGASTRAAVWLCAGSQTLIITRNLEKVLIGSILGHQAPLSVVLAHARKIWNEHFHFGSRTPHENHDEHSHKIDKNAQSLKGTKGSRSHHVGVFGGIFVISGIAQLPSVRAILFNMTTLGKSNSSNGLLLEICLLGTGLLHTMKNQIDHCNPTNLSLLNAILYIAASSIHIEHRSSNFTWICFEVFESDSAWCCARYDHAWP